MNQQRTDYIQCGKCWFKNLAYAVGKDILIHDIQLWYMTSRKEADAISHNVLAGFYCLQHVSAFVKAIAQ